MADRNPHERPRRASSVVTSPLSSLSDDDREQAAQQRTAENLKALDVLPEHERSLIGPNDAAQGSGSKSTAE